jgi:hypothetical protein
MSEINMALVRLVGGLIFLVHFIASASPMDCASLKSKYPLVAWDCGAKFSARLIRNHISTVVIGRQEGSASVAILSTKPSKVLKVFRLKEGAGQDQICAAQAISASVVDASKFYEMECQAGDSMCEILRRGVSLHPGRRLQKLEVVRLDDQACDAMWLYFDQRKHQWHIARRN